jgi:hypothetical protein
VPSHRPEEGRGERHHLVPEKRDGRDQGPGMQGHVEGLVERLVVLEKRVVLKPGNEDQMARGRDRQELGEALDDPQQKRLQFGHRRGILRGPIPLGRTAGLEPGEDEQPTPAIAAARPRRVGLR